MRGDKELDDAVKWLKERGIELFGVNYNPTQSWTTSPKVLANLYIDDAALGCPLITPRDSKTLGYKRPYVDWDAVEKMLEEDGYFNK